MKIKEVKKFKGKFLNIKIRKETKAI